MRWASDDCQGSTVGLVADRIVLTWLARFRKALATIIQVFEICDSMLKESTSCMPWSKVLKWWRSREGRSVSADEAERGHTTHAGRDRTLWACKGRLVDATFKESGCGSRCAC